MDTPSPCPSANANAIGAVYDVLQSAGCGGTFAFVHARVGALVGAGVMNEDEDEERDERVYAGEKDPLTMWMMKA